MRLTGVRLPAPGWRVPGRLALACLALLPLWGLLTANPSIPSRLFVAGLFLGALVRPADALLVLAGLLILAHALGGALHSPYSLAEPMVLAFLGGWLLHGAARQDDSGAARPSVLIAAGLLAAVVAASVLTQLLVARAMADFYWPYFRGVFAFLAGRYFDAPTEVPAINAAAPMIEGLGLFAAAATLGRLPHMATRMVRMAAAGALGLAILNVLRYALVWIASPVEQAAAVLRGARISTLGDYNAVGSYLAMMLLVAVGLAVSERRGRRLAWSGGALLIVAATWLTQSRAALIAIPVALVLFAIWISRARLHSSWWKPVVPLTLALVLLVALVARFNPPDAGQRSAVANVYGRLQMAKVSLQIFETSPLFGVGVGRFWQLSGDYMPKALFASTGNENAHNNFLQILAELGVVGLVLFLWVLVAALTASAESFRKVRAPVVAALASGLVAFLVSSLAGHPLLVRHASYAFWFMLGTLVALTWATAQTTASGPGRAAWHKRVIAAFLVCLAASVPLRAERFLRTEADLTDVAIGFSPWQSGAEGERFRTMVGRAEFYVPAAARFVRLPVRAIDERTLMVEVRLDGRLANRVSAFSGDWSAVDLVLPGSSRRYHRIELTTTPVAVLGTGQLVVRMAAGPRK